MEVHFVEFPVIEQDSVRGPQAHPFLRQLARAAGAVPKWNFHKYLIAPGGAAVYSYGSAVEPDSPEIL